MVDTLRDSEEEATDTTPETDNSVKEGQNPQVSNNDQPAQLTPTSTKRGEKRCREDKIEQTMKGVVQQILASQEASDRHFLELEEKRMKFDEYMVEKEDQQKREEREFRLKMMMMQGPPPPIPPYYPQQSRGPYAYPSYSSGLTLDDPQQDEM